jgi:hypothetical protein
VWEKASIIKLLYFSPQVLHQNSLNLAILLIFLPLYSIVKLSFILGSQKKYCIKIITVDFAPLKPILPFETLQDWINELIIKTFCVGIVGATAWFFQNFEKVFRLQTINASSHENNLLLRKSLFCNENYQLWSFLRAEWNCNIYERPFATCCLFTALILSLNSWKNIL